jgi:hypothetical protein
MSSWSHGRISVAEITVSAATKPFISSPSRTSIPPSQSQPILMLISLS